MKRKKKVPIFRVYIEERATRLFYRDVEAVDSARAEEIGQEAIDSGDWTEWTTSDTDASLEVLTPERQKES
jgi:hypothetical protein